MKKLLICLISLLCICGCSTTPSIDAKISKDNEEVFFKYDGKEYTTNDIFQKLKAQGASAYIDTVIASKANEIEGVSSDSLRAQIEEEYQNMVEEYGEETVIEYYGDKETLVEQTLANNANSAYILNHIKENISSYSSQYPTYYVKYVSSSDEKTMKKFVKNIKKKKGFDEGFEATEFSNNETVTTEVIDDNDSVLPTDVMTAIKSLQPGESSDLITIVTEATEDTEETKTYYIVKVVSKDPANDYFDDFSSYLMNQGIFTTATMLIREKHNIEFFDDDFNYAYNAMVKELSNDTSVDNSGVTE